MDVAELASLVEDLLGPAASLPEFLREGAEEFDDLGDVVVVFTVLSSGLGVEEVVASDKFENL